MWQLNTKDIQEVPKYQKIQKIQNTKVEFGRIISVYHQDCVPHMEKVFSIVRKIYDRKPRDNLKDLDVNTAFWCIFMSAVHLGRDYSLNLRFVKNQSSKSVGQLFRTPEKLIKERTEITGVIVHD